MTIKDKLGYAPLLMLDGGSIEKLNVSISGNSKHTSEEHRFKLAILNKLKLRAKSLGFAVLDISPESYHVPVSIRCNRANKAFYDYLQKNPILDKDKLALYISINYHTFGCIWGESKGGLVIYYAVNDTQSKKLGQFVLDELTKSREKMNKEIKESRLQELRDTLVKSIRIEARLSEEKPKEDWMLDEEFQDQMAKDILKGILKYYGLNEFTNTSINLTDLMIRVEQLEHKINTFEGLLNPSKKNITDN